MVVTPKKKPKKARKKMPPRSVCFGDFLDLEEDCFADLFSVWYETESERDSRLWPLLRATCSAGKRLALGSPLTRLILRAAKTAERAIDAWMFEDPVCGESVAGMRWEKWVERANRDPFTRRGNWPSIVCRRDSSAHYERVEWCLSCILVQCCFTGAPKHCLLALRLTVELALEARSQPNVWPYQMRALGGPEMLIVVLQRCIPMARLVYRTSSVNIYGRSEFTNPVERAFVSMPKGFEFLERAMRCWLPGAALRVIRLDGKPSRISPLNAMRRKAYRSWVRALVPYLVLPSGSDKWEDFPELVWCNRRLSQVVESSRPSRVSLRSIAAFTQTSAHRRHFSDAPEPKRHAVYLAHRRVQAAFQTSYYRSGGDSATKASRALARGGAHHRRSLSAPS